MTDDGSQNAKRNTHHASRTTHHAPRTTQRANPQSLIPNALSAATLALASLIGLAAFLYPFFLTSAPQTGMLAHASDAPLLTVLLLGLCLAVIFASLTSQQMTSKFVAVLGVLTAIGAVLRAVPGPAGFNAIFLLPILAGYAYGPTFGFLLGALSLLVSALVGGGVGPWLPYQMFSTGWVGLLSGWLPELRRRRRWEPVMLAAWGALLGLLFGAIMNIWFWPFIGGGGQTGQMWQPGMAVWATLRNYAAFYVATSLWWDAARAGGNALLILLFGGTILRVLRRFRSRFRFEVTPEVEMVW
jgi:energy-coupling factor transport system substrate-specific component